MAELAIKMSNIVKSFGGAAPVLKDVTLEIGVGEIRGLLGENGAGKSTLMNILGGVIPMDSGKLSCMEKKYRFPIQKNLRNWA